MKDQIRKICKNNTYLADQDIDILLSYADNIETIAEEEECDVFIDCMSKNSNSFIVICEAKPKCVTSLYREPILGKVISAQNEPAVQRTFETGMPTSDLAAIEVPEDKNAVQSTYPIRNSDNNVIGVLIYERDIHAYLSNPFIPKTDYSIIQTFDNKILFDELNEGVISVNEYGKITYLNKAAEQMLQRAGYMGNPLNDNIENYWTSFNDNKYTPRVKQVGSLYIEGRYIKDATVDSGHVLLLKDIEETVYVKEHLKETQLKYREFRHRMKNTFLSLHGFYEDRIQSSDDAHDIEIYREVTDTIRVLMKTTVDMKYGSGDESVNLKLFFGDIGESIINNAWGQKKEIKLSVEGSDAIVPESEAVYLGEFVTELFHNSMKHAFTGRTEGQILITIKEDLFSRIISFQDNGIGFDVQNVKKDSFGIGILKNLAEDKLGGVMEIVSDENGTTVTIEYMM